MKRRIVVSSLLLVALLALSSSVKAQCSQPCSGSTPICDSNSNNCVACTTQAQCWSASDNLLSCDLASGECKTCNTSSTCPEAKPICSTVTSTCATCNATAECAIRMSGSVCNTDLGTCGWCSSDADCASYGPGSACTNITSIVRKCSIPIVPPTGVPGAPDPNNINGLIMAYTIISIVIFLIFIMFVVCACNKDEDYAPSNTPKDVSATAAMTKSYSNGKAHNGTSAEIELEDTPKRNGKAK